MLKLGGVFQATKTTYEAVRFSCASTFPWKKKCGKSRTTEMPPRKGNRLIWKQIVRFPMDPNTVYVLESRLISMDGATQIPISEFEASRWHNSRVCVWYFQVCKFQFCLLAKYFILAKKLQLLTHKLRPDCSWGETDPLLCLSFSTWAALKQLMDLNIAWACFRACFPGTNMLAPAYVNARGWTSSSSRFAPVWQ